MSVFTRFLRFAISLLFIATSARAADTFAINAPMTALGSNLVNAADAATARTLLEVTVTTNSLSTTNYTFNANQFTVTGGTNIAVKSGVTLTNAAHNGNITVTGNVLPDAAGTRSVGSSTYYFGPLYVTNILSGGGGIVGIEGVVVIDEGKVSIGFTDLSGASTFSVSGSLSVGATNNYGSGSIYATNDVVVGDDLSVNGSITNAALSASTIVFTDANKVLTSGGTVVVTNGGTGAATLTGLVRGNGTAAMTAVTGTQNSLIKWSGTGGTNASSSLISDDGSSVYGTAASYQLTLSGSDKLSLTAASAANDTKHTAVTLSSGTDGTHGPLLFQLGLYPSATGSNRYAVIESGDSSAWRNVVMVPSGGNVGVGTTNVTQKLSVGGSVTATGGVTASGSVTGSNIVSTVSSGTAPLTVTSTNLVANLNADYLDGYHASDILTASGLILGSANQVLGMNAAGSSTEYKTINGTASQVTVAHAANSVTLSLPQNIASNSSPTFSELTLTNVLASKPMFTDAAKKLTTTGTVPAAQGGTGATTLTGLVRGNGTAAMTAVTGTANTYLKWTGTGGTNVGNGLISDDGSSVYGTAASYQLTLSGSDKLSLTAASAANDTKHTAVTLSSGTDGTLGPLLFQLGLYPSATGSNRYAVIESGDSSAWRNVVMVPSGGNVGVGTTNVTQKLSVGGSVTATGGVTASGSVTGSNIVSTVSSGTAPLTVTSTNLVANLNADMLDTIHASSFSQTNHTHTFSNLTSTPTTRAGYGITDAQQLDADLTALAALSGTGGWAKRTASDTWTISTPTSADVGASATNHQHDASAITNGVINTARLGSGTTNTSVFLRGDSTWASPPAIAAYGQMYGDGGITGVTDGTSSTWYQLKNLSSTNVTSGMTFTNDSTSSRLSVNSGYAGKYLVTATCSANCMAGTQFRFGIAKNGTVQTHLNQWIYNPSVGVGAQDLQFSVTGIVDLGSVGDSISISIWGVVDGWDAGIYSAQVSAVKLD